MRSHARTFAAVLTALLTLPVVASGQSWRTVTMSRQLASESALDVKVEYGAGHFTVRPADAGRLYEMRLRYDEEVLEPQVDYDDGRLRIGLESHGRDIRIGKGRSGGEMTLHLARGVPMDLDLEFGAVRADLDLGGLDLTDLDLSTGASESVVDISEPNRERMDVAHFEVGAADFTIRHLGNLNADRIQMDTGVGSVTLWLNGEWRRDARVGIDMGLGKLELRIPEGLGIRLTKDSFLTSLDSEGLVKRGDSYYSVDWDEADRKVTIDLDAAFGKVDVVWVR